MEEEFLHLQCPFCEENFGIPFEVVRQEMRHAKFVKVVTVARQLHEHRGPFYEKWKAAMEARGEQKRCKECVHFNQIKFGGRYMGMKCKDALYTGGEFACSRFELKEVE